MAFMAPVVKLYSFIINVSEPPVPFREIPFEAIAGVPIPNDIRALFSVTVITKPFRFGLAATSNTEERPTVTESGAAAVKLVLAVDTGTVLVMVSTVATLVSVSAGFRSVARVA